MHDNFSGIRRGTIKLCKQKWAIYSRLALWPAISLVPPLQDRHLYPVHPVGGVAGQKRAQGSAQFVFICGFYENWVCLLLLCEMYKYLWNKEEEEEIERERQRQMAEETTLSTLWKKNHTQICGSNCFACFVKHTSTCQMHNRQLKWKITHELVALAKLPHLISTWSINNKHSTGEIVHKLSPRQSLAVPTKAARGATGAAAETGSGSRSRSSNGSHCRRQALSHSQIRAQSANQDHSNALPIVCPAKQTT